MRDYTRAPERRQKKKPTPPRCAPCPFQGKGLTWTLPPSYGRRCPEGAEVGWGKRYEKERGDRLKCAIIREHPSAAQKGSQPRLAVLGSPFQGKGLAWTLPPSIGRRCPEGAEVGWGKRYEREEDRLRPTIHESTLCKQLIKPIYSYKKRKSNAANDFNVIYRSGYRYMQEKSEAVHFYD